MNFIAKNIRNIQKNILNLYKQKPYLYKSINMAFNFYSASFKNVKLPNLMLPSESIENGEVWPLIVKAPCFLDLL